LIIININLNIYFLISRHTVWEPLWYSLVILLILYGQRTWSIILQKEHKYKLFWNKVFIAGYITLNKKRWGNLIEGWLRKGWEDDINIVRVKVKLSLWRCMGVEVYFHSFLTLALDGSKWSASLHGALTSTKKSLVPLSRRVRRFHNRSGLGGEEKNSCPYRELNRWLPAVA
jgi:hypothetical protein